MKTLNQILVLSSAALLTLCAGCSKQQSEPPTAATETQKVVDNAAAEVKKAADTVQTQAATGAQKVVDNAAAEARKATDTIQTQAAGVASEFSTTIESVKKLLAEKKPAEALKVLSDLATAKVTPEQMSTIEVLKKEAQAMMQSAATSTATDKAAEAVGGLLKK